MDADDVTDALAPKSDQLTFAHVESGPMEVTVARVEQAKISVSETQLIIHFMEFPGQPLKPGKIICRVIAKVWGKQAREWIGRRMRLYGDPSIKYGGKAVGGVRLSHMSGLEAPRIVEVSAGAGTRARVPLEPLDDPIQPHLSAFAAATSLPELKAAWERASADGVGKNPQVIAATNQRKGELQEVGE